MPPGRNDPCPCGSGKKYKKCCANVFAEERTRLIALETLDRQVTARIIEFGRNQPNWTPLLDSPVDLQRDADAATFFGHWAAYELRDAEKRTMADRFRVANEASLDASAIALLEAQKAARLSIWKVASTERGRSARIHDAFTEEERTVLGDFLNITVGDHLLSRVVAVDGVAFFSGTHPNVFDEANGPPIVRAIEAELANKADADAKPFAKTVIATWEATCKRFDEVRRAVGGKRR